MKTAKKLTALLIVLTLLFALSVTAFAFDPQTQYRIKFFVNGTEQNDWEIVADENVSVYEAIEDAYEDDVQFNLIPGTDNYVLVSLNNRDAEPSENPPYPYSTATPVSGHDGYFLIETGDLGYHYLYAGYDWTYQYEGGVDPEVYMNYCYPAANSVIEVRYSMQAMDWWQGSPIS